MPIAEILLAFIIGAIVGAYFAWYNLKYKECPTCRGQGYMKKEMRK